MKFLILFLISFNAIAGLPPTSLKGQNDTNATTTFFFQAPNNQVTPVAPSTGLIETGNKDILSNGSFEHTTYTTGWTSTGTAVNTEETTEVIDGKKAIKITATAQTISLIQDTTLYQSQLTAQPALISMWIKNTNASLDICFRQAGVTNYCLGAANVPDTGVWEWVRLPVILKGTSNGVEFSAVSSTGVTVIDGVQLELKDPLELQQIQYKAVLDATGSGNFTGGSVLVTRQGNQVNISQITTITHASSSSPQSAIGFIPVWARPSAGISNSYYTLPNNTRNVISKPDGQLSLGYTTMDTGGAVLLTSNAVPFTISYSVNDNLDNTLFTYDRCADRRNCETVFSASISAAGVVSGENLDWISGNCSSPGAGRYTCNLQSIFTIAPLCTTNTLRSSTLDGRITSVTTTTSSFDVGHRNLANVLTDGAFYIICQRQGTDYQRARVNQILGQFLASNLDGGLDYGLGFKLKSCLYSFGGAGSASAPTSCTSSPCTEYQDTCATGTAPTRAGAGSYSLVFADGTWANSSLLKCTLSSNSGPAWINNIPLVSSASGGATISINTNGISGGSVVAADRYTNIECKGIAP